MSSRSERGGPQPTPTPLAVRSFRFRLLIAKSGNDRLSLQCICVQRPSVPENIVDRAGAIRVDLVVLVAEERIWRRGVIHAIRVIFCDYRAAKEYLGSAACLNAI